MKIVCDQYIPFLVESINQEWPDVQICPMEPEQINAQNVRSADVLIVRSRTHVDETLLCNSHVRLVCTATIGFDHIDTAWCDAHHIRWVACPGCNAQAVCDYIKEALEELDVRDQETGIKTIGIVGVGHVGSRVAQMAKQMGLTVLLNDPPKKIGVSINSIARQCDVITFHTPLTDTTQPYSTYHLCNADFLRMMKPNAVIINAARGGIVDEQALLKSEHPFILDTWENEPHINPEVLKTATMATMHIAGYSLEGKRNATQMCLDAIAESFALPPIHIPISTNNRTRGDSNCGWIKRISDRLKADPDQFENLRKQYALR